MQSSLWKTLICLTSLLVELTIAQQYAGDVIPNSLPAVPGSEIAYFKIKEPTGKTPKAYNLTLTNYQSLQANGKQLDPLQIQRAVIIVHGLQRDPGLYISNVMTAISQETDPNINRSTVAMMAPYFPNGDDKNSGYPYNETNPAVPGKTYSGSARSYTGALVWQASQWSGGGVNQYPAAYTTVSSYYVLDTLIQWYANKAVFPNVKQIVIAGHSLGGQTVQRYAIAGKLASELGVTVPVTYWIANPNSYAWLDETRPLSTAGCPTYNDWREGLNNYTGYISPAVYQNTLMTSGNAAVQANYNAKNKAYARGLLDTGDDSSGCQPATTGANRNERFFAFINKFPPVCQAPNSTSGHCDTVDFMQIGHDAGSMMASPAGRARLFEDNFYGDGARTYDSGYPRVQQGDDPYPNPYLATNNTSVQTYAGNMTLQGCFTDSTNTRSLAFQSYDSNTNTIEKCTQACVDAGYTIAGVEYGSQCYCGNVLSGTADKVVAVGCSMTCPGNSSETCGDLARLNVYSNGAPIILAPPSQPKTVGAYTSFSCNSEATGARALSSKAYSDATNMTLESCASFCSGYNYFGIEYARECYCGNCFNAGSGALGTSSCSMTCTGNASEYCGGNNALSVYQVSTNTNTTANNCTGGTGGATSTAPASSIPTASLCPATNGQTLSDSSNSTYQITCSSDSSLGSYASFAASTSYLDCMDACDARSSTGCQGFTYVGATNGAGSGTCYFKTALGSLTAAGSNLITGQKMSSGTGSSSSVSSSGTATGTSSAAATATAVQCPTSDSTTFTASNGAQFLIECGIDHSGGDMSNVVVSDFASCINACATTTGCVDVSLSGQVCYLKSTLGGAVNSASIWGAKLVSSASSSTSSSVSSSSMSSSSVTSSTGSATASSTSAAFPGASSTTCPGLDKSSMVDSNGAVYNVYCSADLDTATLSVMYSSTGISACMTECDSTTGCSAITYAASDSTLGSGYCYLRTTGPTMGAGSTTLVAVQVAGPGSATPPSTSSSSSSSVASSTSSTSPATTSSASSTSASSTSTNTAFPGASSTTCPGLDKASMVDSKGAIYNVYCTSDTNTATLSVMYSSTGMDGCMTGCDAATGCNAFTFAASDTTLTSGYCYLRTAGPILGGSSTTVVAVQVSGPGSATPPSSSSSSSTLASSSSSTASSSSSSITSSTVSSSSTSVSASASSTVSRLAAATATTCPGMDKSSMVDSQGAVYNVYCSADTNTATMSTIATSTGIDGCMVGCDTTTGCNSFTFAANDNALASGFCYLRTSGPLLGGGSTLVVAVQVSGPGSATPPSTSSSSTVSSSVTSSSRVASSTATSSSSTISSSTSTSASSTVSRFAAATATTCPGMDKSSVVDSKGAIYNVYCSSDTGNQATVMYSSTGMDGCMTGCDSTAGCNAFTFAANDNTLANGYCYLRTAGPIFGAGSTVLVAVQIAGPGSATPPSTSSSRASSSSSTATSSIASSVSSYSSSITSAKPSSTSSSSTVVSSTSTTTTFPATSATTCPGMNQSSLVDANGSVYNIYCSADTNTGILAVMTTTSGIQGCMANCDKTTGCTAFTYAGDSKMTGGYCYLRTVGGRSSSTSNTLVVAQLVSRGSGPSFSSSKSSSSGSATSSVPARANFAAAASSDSSSSSSSSSSSVISSTSSSTVSSVTPTSSSSSSSASSSSSSSSVAASSSTSSSVSSTSNSVSSSSIASSTSSSSSSAQTTSTVNANANFAAPASSSSLASSSSSVSSSSSSSSSSSAASPSVTSSSSSAFSTASSSSTSTSSTVSVTPTAPAIVYNNVGKEYDYLGCYNDTSSARALNSTMLYGTTQNNMTLEKCATFCGQYSYFGVEYGQECYCGKTIGNGSYNSTLTQCTKSCPGNSTELCGGGNALQMYMAFTTSTSSSAGAAQATGTPVKRRRGLQGLRGFY
ncbi:hypothetical protein AAFC00_006419 [Neodothiora populina]|uniref:WSC domain-containing protein n=1 Tax=Neodothiora populina TaxID=2781224 RepID=A0ABR3P5H3_9PEZI